LKLLIIFTFLLCNSAQAQYKVFLPEFYSEKNFSLPQKMNLKEIDDLVKKIYRSNKYEMVYAEKTGTTQVQIRTFSNANYDGYSFTGNNSITSEEIKENLPELSKDKLTNSSILKYKDAIQRLYKSRGFFNTKISTSQQNVAGNASLSFMIDENEPAIISNISAFSRNDTLNQRVNDLLKSYVGKGFNNKNKNEIQILIEEYLKKHRFLKASISEIEPILNNEKTLVSLKVAIKDPILHEFVFIGNVAFSQSKLIQESQVDGRILFVNQSGSELVDKLESFYKSKGFPFIEIDYTTNNINKLNKKVIVINVKEGSRIRIKNIKIIGAITKDKGFYRNIIRQSLILKGHSLYFVQNSIEIATAELETKLKIGGFLEAAVTNIEYSFDKKNRVSIEIELAEGPLTYIRQVLFQGAQSFSSNKLKEEVRIQTNSPFDLDTIKKSFDRIRLFYLNQGFLEFRHLAKNSDIIQFTKGQPFADLVFQIHEGPKIYVKSIEIEGNRKTKPYVIRREISFNVGDPLTKEKIERTTDLLEKTGLFSSVDINSAETGTNLSNRTIIVKVNERKPGVFSSGIGINNVLGPTARGYLGSSYSNLGGKARGLNARLDLKYSFFKEPTFDIPIDFLENRIALSYYEPYLFKNRIRGNFSLVRDQRVFEIVPRGNDWVPRILSTNEAIFLGEREIAKDIRLIHRLWGFANQTVFDRSDNRRNSSSINIGTLGPTIEMDFRNNKLSPTKGALFRFDVEYSSPYIGSTKAADETQFLPGRPKEINYLKTSFWNTFYIPLVTNHRYIWANSVRGGYLRNLSDRNASGIPGIKSFFLGGSSTIRGFTNRTERIPNLNELCAFQGLVGEDCNLAEFYVPKESTYFLLKTELRFPLISGFSGLVFYDGGAVYLRGIPLKDRYRDSVGFGIRAETAVGAFVAEIGFKLNRKPEESAFALHLSLGSF